MHRASPIGKLRTVVFILCLAIVSCVITYAFLTRGDTSVLGKDEISARIEEMSGKDLGYTNVSSYLMEYGITNLNSTKLDGVEMAFEERFYKPLPEKPILARDTALLFIKNYYAVSIFNS